MCIVVLFSDSLSNLIECWKYINDIYFYVRFSLQNINIYSPNSLIIEVQLYYDIEKKTTICLIPVDYIVIINEATSIDREKFDVRTFFYTNML